MSGAPEKLCVRCSEVLAAGARVCPACGYRFDRTFLNGWTLGAVLLIILFLALEAAPW